MAHADPTPEIKKQLADKLVETLRGWTTTEALFGFRLDPSRLSDIRRGRLKRFSIDQLIRLNAAGGTRVTIQFERERQLAIARRKKPTTW